MKNGMEIPLMKIPENKNTCEVIVSNRDPCEKDFFENYVMWFSREFVPNKVFQGLNGDWIYLGKFYPNENCE